MLLLRANLSITIASDTRNSSTDGTRNSVGDAGTEVVELALGFLGFAFGVLLVALLLQALWVMG